MSGSWPDLDGRRRSLGQAPPPPRGFYQPQQPFNPAVSLLPMPPTRYGSGNSEHSQPASPFATVAALHPDPPQPTGGGILSPRSRLPPPTALPMFSQPPSSLRPSASQDSNPEPGRPPRRLDLEAAGSVAPLGEESSTSFTPDVQSQLRGQQASFRSLLPTPPQPAQQYTRWPQAGAAPAPMAQPWAAPALPQAQAAATQAPSPAASAPYGVSSRQGSMASIGSTPTMPPAGLPPPPAQQEHQPAAWDGQYQAQPEQQQAWGEQPQAQQEAPSAWGDQQYQYQAQQQEEQAWGQYQAEESAACWPATEAHSGYEAVSPDLPPPPGSGHSPIKAFYYKWQQPGYRPAPASCGHGEYAPPAAKQAVPELDVAAGSSYPHLPGGSDCYGSDGAQPPVKDAESSWGQPLPSPPASMAYQAPENAMMSLREPASTSYRGRLPQPAMPHAFMPGQATDTAPAHSGVEPASAGFAAPPALHSSGPPGGAQPAAPAFFQAGAARPPPGGFMPQSAGFGTSGPPAQTFEGTSVFTPRAPEASGQGSAPAASLPSGPAQPARKQRRRRSICGRLMPLLLLCSLAFAAFSGAGTVVAITAAARAAESAAATLASFPWRAILSSSREPLVPATGALAALEPALHAAVLRLQGAHLWAEGQAVRVVPCERRGKACRSVHWTAHKMCLGAALSKELALAAAATARSAPAAAARTWERLRQPGALDFGRAQVGLAREAAGMLGDADGRAALWAQAKQRLAASKAAAVDGGRWLRCSVQHLQTCSDWSVRGLSNGVVMCWAEHMGRYYHQMQQYHEELEQPDVVEAPEQAAARAAAEPPAEPGAADARSAPVEPAPPEAAAVGAGLDVAPPTEAAAATAAEEDVGVVEEPLPAEEGPDAPSTPEPHGHAHATAGKGNVPEAVVNATAAELPAPSGPTIEPAALPEEQAPEQPPAPANVTGTAVPAAAEAAAGAEQLHGEAPQAEVEPLAAAAEPLSAAAEAPPVATEMDAAAPDAAEPLAGSEAVDAAAAAPPVATEMDAAAPDAAEPLAGSEAVDATGHVPPEPEAATPPPEVAAADVAHAGVQSANATLASQPAAKPAAVDSIPAAEEAPAAFQHAEAPPAQPEEPALPVQRQEQQPEAPAQPNLAEDGPPPQKDESQETAQPPGALEPAASVLPAEPASTNPYEDDAAYFGLPPPAPQQPADPEAQQPAEPTAPTLVPEQAAPEGPAAQPEAAPEPPAAQQLPEEVQAEAPQAAPALAAPEQPVVPGSGGPPLRERFAAALDAAKQAVVEHQAVGALLGTGLAAVAAAAAAVCLTVYKARQAQLLPMTPLLSPDEQLPRTAQASSRGGRAQPLVAEEEEEDAGEASDGEEAAPSVSRSLLASLLGTKADTGEEVEQAAPGTSKRGRGRKSAAALAPVAEAEEGPAPATSSRRRKAAAPAAEAAEGADTQPPRAASRPGGRGKSEAGGSKTPRASALAVSVQTTKTTVTRRARGKADPAAE